MQKNYTQLLLGVIIGLLVGLTAGKYFFASSKNTEKESNLQNVSTPKNQGNIQSTAPKEATTESSNHYSGKEEIPQKVYEILKYIKSNGKAMDGYVGGRVFQNREKQLPMNDNGGNKINYQEWDVNPKVNGKNRGAERMVTGSDGRSWYTTDHYRTFTEIK
jgi:ribonuclease T1